MRSDCFIVSLTAATVMTPASSLFYVFVLFISLFFYHNTNALSTHMQIFCKTNIFLCFLAYCSHSNGILLLKKTLYIKEIYKTPVSVYLCGLIRWWVWELITPLPKFTHVVVLCRPLSMCLKQQWWTTSLLMFGLHQLKFFVSAARSNYSFTSYCFSRV